jgi:hypothetical protein
MADALKKLKLDVPYRTGPLAWTDLHAGGFFCVVYRECLQFSIGFRVRRWCEVIDDFRQFHDEVEQLRAKDKVGSYRVERGYLECAFPEWSYRVNERGTLEREHTPDAERTAVPVGPRVIGFPRHSGTGRVI